MLNKKIDPKYDKTVLKYGCFIFSIVLLIMLIFFWVVKDNWKVQYIETQAISPKLIFSDHGQDLKIEQIIISDMDNIENIALYTYKHGYTGVGKVDFSIIENENRIYHRELLAEEMPDAGYYKVYIEKEYLKNIKGKELKLCLTVPYSENGLAVNFSYGTSVDVGKFEMTTQEDIGKLSLDGNEVLGRLSFSVFGSNKWNALEALYTFYALCLALLVFTIFNVAYKKANNKHSFVLFAVETAKKYQFLIHQLVGRDFITKYKNSMLGMLWSFLNPLIMMSVQYLVFSVLFKSSISNFPLYLLTGVIIFNFFIESVSSGLESITSNAGLLNKVYVPKYIYPMSKVLSSMVNLIIAFLPLFFVMIISGVAFTKALLLLPIGLLLLIMFCLGMSFILATANVFFRDTRFLWGILSTLWMYLTPIFYPESIIPAGFKTLYHLNPMYQFLYFFRKLIIDGMTPSPNSYIWCFACAAIPLIFGIWVFRKNQDNFILYL